MDSLELTELTGKIKDKIEQADMVLVGIGDEFCVRRDEILKQNLFYSKFASQIEALPKDRARFLSDSLYMYELTGHCDSHQAFVQQLDLYQKLAQILDGKNYYIITTCTDDVIKFSELNQDRVVCPCGSRMKLQCMNNCGCEVCDAQQVYEALYPVFERQLEEEIFEADKMMKILPVCPECQGPIETNLVDTEHYNEQGYLTDWSRYTMWLQGTLNHKICILELGVGFRFPTVIRWPFEKIANLNRKADFVRVHETLAQTAKELQEKAVSVKLHSKIFIEEMSKSYQKEDKNVKAE